MRGGRTAVWLLRYQGRHDESTFSTIERSRKPEAGISNPAYGRWLLASTARFLGGILKGDGTSSFSGARFNFCLDEIK